MTASNVLYATREVARLGARSVAGAQARVDGYVTRRMAQEAEDLSRRAVLQARVDVANTALHRWGALMYETSPGGRPLNVAPSGQIQIAAPWSRLQHAAYGLSDPDARVLLAVVRRLLTDLPGRYRAIVYDPHERRWYLSAKYAPTDAAGFRGWLDTYLHITLDVWVPVWEELRAQKGQQVG